ncbi:hypothetical protein O181_071636 [Austropuccinia psidii MF-1]|uniref:Reverse transcriptase Ty1/copia-type domain-containing protein n=1 Tax=Austropuccinia psidii MF-1 TaxID=1389203 RepID=A0A9Q3F7N3_9BASI|nr:hypothetical protein [Austropuccinia psidii MF-1]
MNWEIKSFDVVTAYLQRNLSELIYVCPLKGYSAQPNRTLKLNKALCGLKQVRRCWWQHLKELFSEIWFQPNKDDQSTYSYEEGRYKALLWIHVDDGVLGASNATLMDNLRNRLQEKLSLKWDLGICSIFGIEVQREGNKFYLSQPALSKEICESHLSDIMAEKPLLDVILESGPEKQINKDYLSKIHMLLYLAQAKLLDIMFSLNYLA